MSKTDDQLRSEVGTNEARGDWGAWAVIVGLVLEVALATANSLGYGNRDVENWGAVVADSLVALGVYAEVHFGRRASHGISELRRRSDEKVAAANERAARLEKEAADARGRVADIERLTAYRHISDEQRQIIIEELRPIAGTLDVFIEFQEGDPEAWSYGNKIASVFQLAGAKAVSGRPNRYPLNVVFGAWLSGLKEPDASLVVSCFAKAHVQVSQYAHDPLRMPPKHPPPDIRMFIGPKPPPAFPVLPTNEGNPGEAKSASEIAVAAQARRILADQRAEIIRTIRGNFPLTHDQIMRGKHKRNEGEKLVLEVEIQYENDPETQLFAQDIRETFKELGVGWIRPEHSITMGSLIYGLHFFGTFHPEIVAEAFANAGVAVAKDDSLETRWRNGANRPAYLRVCVGHKPQE